MLTLSARRELCNPLPHRRNMTHVPYPEGIHAALAEQRSPEPRLPVDPMAVAQAAQTAVGRQIGKGYACTVHLIEGFPQFVIKNQGKRGEMHRPRKSFTDWAACLQSRRLQKPSTSQGLAPTTCSPC